MRAIRERRLQLVQSPTRLLRAGVAATAIAALVLAVVVRMRLGAPTAAQHLVGHTAQNFSLMAEADGHLLAQPVTLSAYRGHPVLLLFVYSLCPHCLGEVSDVRAIERDYGPRGLDVLYVDSPGESMDVIATYAQRLGVGQGVLLDAHGDVAAQYGIRRYPAIVLIDRNGTVRRSWIGETDTATLRAGVETLMHG